MAFLTNISKIFDLLSQALMIAKLHAYRLDMLSFRLMHYYLIKRKKKIKVNDRKSFWSKILFRVPHGPLPFNIFICDQFFFASNPNANYADDNQLTNPENIFLAHR